MQRCFLLSLGLIGSLGAFATAHAGASGGIREPHSSNARPAFSAPRPLTLKATCCTPSAATVVRSGVPVFAWLLGEGELAESARPVRPLPHAIDAIDPAFQVLPPLPPLPERDPALAEIPDVDSTVTLLRTWERASHSLEPMTEARRDRLAREWRETHNGHEIDLMTAFQAPISADELCRQWEWRTESVGDGAAVLTAIPRDAVARLFVRRLELTLEFSSGLPSDVTFLRRSGSNRLASTRLRDFPRYPQREPALLTAEATSDALPARPLLRTAAFQVENVTGDAGTRSPVTLVEHVAAMPVAKSESESFGPSLLRQWTEGTGRWIRRLSGWFANPLPRAPKIERHSQDAEADGLK